MCPSLRIVMASFGGHKKLPVISPEALPGYISAQRDQLRASLEAHRNDGIEQRDLTAAAKARAAAKAKSQAKPLSKCAFCNKDPPDHLGRNCPMNPAILAKKLARCYFCHKESPDHPGNLCPLNPAVIAALSLRHSTSPPPYQALGPHTRIHVSSRRTEGNLKPQIVGTQTCTTGRPDGRKNDLQREF